MVDAQPLAFCSHRKRQWYMEHKRQWEADNAAVFSWSSIYTFSTSGALGITAMGSVLENGRLVGVTAADYTLVRVCSIRCIRIIESANSMAAHMLGLHCWRAAGVAFRRKRQLYVRELRVILLIRQI